MSGLYKARTSRQAVSNASVGTEHPDLLFRPGRAPTSTNAAQTLSIKA